MSDFTLELDGALAADTEIGRGNVLVVSGRLAPGPSPIRRVTVAIGERVHVCNDPLDTARPPAGRAFWLAVPLPGALAGTRADVVLTVELRDGATLRRRLGATRFSAARRTPLALAGRRSGEEPLVAICLAAYEPDPDAFERQLRSIEAQRFENWVCIVSDDASSPPCTRYLAERLRGDDRFHLCRNARNRGFYGNFEQALRSVPAQADFVALADQDDRWYPDKLERLLALFDDDTTLVYSDMRIVDGAGRELAPTYWHNRRNEYERLDYLLLANTVTGAASMFRAELLAELLPFPPRIGDAFHDHWIACVALACGRIRYVDAPLYDYYQHDTSVIGQCDFGLPTVRSRLRIAASVLGALAAPRRLKPALLRVRNASLAVFRGECRRLEVIGAVIAERCRVESASKRRALALFGGGFGSGLKLLGLHAAVLARRHTTNDAEVRLAMGYLVRWLDTLLARRARRTAPSAQATTG